MNKNHLKNRRDHLMPVIRKPVGRKAATPTARPTKREWSGLIGRSDFMNSLRRYHTTAASCDCPDHRFRKVRCKHMLLVRFADAVLQTAQENREEKRQAA